MAFGRVVGIRRRVKATNSGSGSDHTVLSPDSERARTAPADQVDESPVPAAVSTVVNLQRLAGNVAVTTLLGRSPGTATGQSVTAPGKTAVTTPSNRPAGSRRPVQRQTRAAAPELLERIDVAQRALTNMQWDHAEGWDPIVRRARAAGQGFVNGLDASVQQILRWVAREDQALIRSLATDRSLTLVAPTVSQAIGAAIPGPHGKVAAYGTAVYLGNLMHDQRQQQLEDTSTANAFLNDLGIQRTRTSMALVGEYGHIMHELGSLNGRIAGIFAHGQPGRVGRVGRLHRDLAIYERDLRSGRAISHEVAEARCNDAIRLREEYTRLVRRFYGKITTLQGINGRMGAARQAALTRLRETYAHHLATTTGRQELRARRLVGHGRGIHLRGEIRRLRGGRWGGFTIKARLMKVGGIRPDRLSSETRAHLESLSPVELSRMATGGVSVKMWFQNAPPSYNTDMPYIGWGKPSFINGHYLRQMTVGGGIFSHGRPSERAVERTILALIGNVPVGELARDGRQHQW